MSVDATRRAAIRLISGVRGGRFEVVDSGRTFACHPSSVLPLKSWIAGFPVTASRP